MGVQVTEKGDFKKHIGNITARCRQVSGWLLRTFRNRNEYFMRFLYRTYIGPHLDYACQVWAPTSLKEMDSLEGVIRAWTRRIPSLQGYHFWDRLKRIRLSSVQRRIERYTILYAWKMIEAHVSTNGAVTAKWGLKGRTLVVPGLTGSAATKTLRRASFTFRSAMLYNSLPRELRDYGGAGTTPTGFKSMLDTYLELVPDQPRDLVGGHLPAAVDINTGVNSNSLVHWRSFLQSRNPQYTWN